MVLEPLILESREDLEEKIPQWKNMLETLNSGESEKRHIPTSRLFKKPVNTLKKNESHGSKSA